MTLDLSLAANLPASELASLVFAPALWYLSTVPNAPAGTRWWAAAFLAASLPVMFFGCQTHLDGHACTQIDETKQALAFLLFAQGLLTYSGRPLRRRWLAGAATTVAAWALAVAGTGAGPGWIAGGLESLGALLLLYAAVEFVRSPFAFAPRVHQVTGGALVILGVHGVLYPWLGENLLPVLVSVLAGDGASVVAGVGLIIVVQRGQHHLADQDRLRTAASEERARASEARFRDLIENSVMGMLILRGNRLVFANHACARIFGYTSAADLLALEGAHRLAQPDELPRLRSYILARREGHSAPEQYVFGGQKRDGTAIWVECIVRPVEWEGLSCSQATLYDVTEARRFEEELRSHQRLLRTVVDSISHIVLVRDREGRILMVNRAWCEATGADPEASIGKTLPELGLYPQAEAQAVQDHSARVVASEQPMIHEHEMTVLAGRRRFHTIRTPLRGEDGGVVGVVSVSLDITEQRDTEEQLRRGQKMEAVGQLTGGVAHDFNNLLSVILGNLELLESRLDGDERAAGYVQRAVQATERGAALTQRLLAFSRRQTLQPRPVNLERQVGDVLELLRSSLGETIRIETRLHPDAGPVLVDPHQVENALVNLALNARDAMPEGGTLVIEAAPADVVAGVNDPLGDAPRGDWVVLTVRDTGRGMPEAVRERAVEPFFTTKEQGHGSGLGLSMVYGFMDQSGGHMVIDSREGEGTAVRLYFRRAQRETPEAGPAAATPAARAAERTVLVVEDDPLLGNVAAEMLAALHYPAIVVGDGPSALQTLQDHEDVGLLFTDVVLPNGMDGVMLAGEARRMRPGLKVLFTSGYAETVFARHPTEIVGAPLLHKPYRLGDLSAKLEQVLSLPVSAD